MSYQRLKNGGQAVAKTQFLAKSVQKVCKNSLIKK